MIAMKREVAGVCEHFRVFRGANVKSNFGDKSLYVTEGLSMRIETT